LTHRYPRIAAILLISLLATTLLYANLAGPPPGHTGAPGEGTCADAGCHDSFTPNSRGTLDARLFLHNWPHQETLRVVISVEADSTFVHGFQVTVLDTTGNPVGDLFLMDSLNTQIAADTSGQQFAAHTLSGSGNATTSKYWELLWTSAADTELTVVAYASAVLADSNGGPDGDWVLTDTDTLTVTPGECWNICGDLDINGYVSSNDCILLRKFNHYALLPADVDTLCADTDGHDRLTLRDMMWLVSYVFWGGPASICPPDQSEYVPQPSTDFAILMSAVWPADSSRVRIYPEFRATAPYSSFAADFYIDVEGEVPHVAEWLPQAPPEAGWEWMGMYYPAGFPESLGVIMLTFDDLNRAAGPPDTYALGWFDIELPAAPYPRRINYRLAGFPEGHNRPMMVDTALVGWEIQSEPYLVRLTGDCNADWTITSADIVWLVNYVFKGGESPYPLPAVGDADCTGNVTAADIIRMVGFVFKSGAAPCDVEEECSFTDLMDWTCP
jgi:hypothetical protein